MVITSGSRIEADDIVIENPYIPFSFDRLMDVMDYKTAKEKALEEIDKIFIQKALKETNYNKLKASKLLGISPRALHYKIKKLFK